MLDFTLTEEQLKIQQHAREFAINEVLPAAWEYDEKDQIPLHVIKKAYEEGITNSDVPKEYGGKGYGIVEGSIITEEIAAACPGIATSIFDNSLGMEPLILSNNEKLKKKYLPEIINNFKLICFATSEPTMGSDVMSMRCKATPDGDDYILNGTKYWITNGGVADYMTVFATVDPEQKHAGICAFLVEKNWEGVSIGKHIAKLGQRCSNTVGINLKNVRVPKENVIAPPGEGFVLAMRTFSRTRPVIGAFAVGAARAAMEYAIEYTKKRRAFGTKISNFQAVQFKLAEMYQKVETSRLLVYKAAWQADSEQDPTIAASISKFYATESALSVVNDALQLFGGYGYTKMFPIEKLWRDTRLFMIYEGTSEVQRMVVGGHVLNNYETSVQALEDLPIFWERSHVPEEDQEKDAWRCRMCGHTHYGDDSPEECPVCFFKKEIFKKVWPREK